MDEEFYVGIDAKRKCKGKNKKSKALILIYVCIAVVVCIWITGRVLRAVKTRPSNGVERYYEKIEKVEEKYEEKEAKIIFRYVQDKEYADEEQLINENYVIDIYDNFTYIKKTYENNNRETYTIEKGKISEENYMKLDEIMNKFANKGIENSDEIDNLELELSARALYKIRENMYLNDYIGDDATAFKDIERIFKSKSNFTIDTSEEVICNE